MTNDNQYTDAAQLAAHRARERLAQLERETRAGWRFLSVTNTDMTQLFDEVAALRKENERLRAAHKQIVGIWKLWNDYALSDTAAIVRMKTVAEEAVTQEAADDDR